MQSLKSERAKKEYEQFVKEVTPKQNLFCNMAKAFIVGGLICVVGQILLHIGKTQFSLSKDDAGSWCSLILILSSVILTGLNIYQKIVTFAGCGALVPITGFANSVAAPAIEYKKKDRSSASVRKFSPSPDLSFCTVFLQAGCSAFSIGCGPLPGTGFKSVPQRFRLSLCSPRGCNGLFHSRRAAVSCRRRKARFSLPAPPGFRLRSAGIFRLF